MVRWSHDYQHHTRLHRRCDVSLRIHLHVTRRGTSERGDTKQVKQVKQKTHEEQLNLGPHGRYVGITSAAITLYVAFWLGLTILIVTGVIK
jgi:hypothetical protein